MIKQICFLILIAFVAQAFAVEREAARPRRRRERLVSPSDTTAACPRELRKRSEDTIPQLARLEDGIYRGVGPLFKGPNKVGELELIVHEGRGTFRQAGNLLQRPAEFSMDGFPAIAIGDDKRTFMISFGAMSDIHHPWVLFFESDTDKFTEAIRSAELGQTHPVLRLPR